MKSKTLLGIVFIFILGAFLVTPYVFIYAQGSGTGTSGSGTGTGTTDDNGGVQTGTTTIKLPNPIGVDDLLEFVKTIFDIVWKIGIPVIAVFIIYAGFSFVRARGNSTELEKAKKMFVGVLIGAAIVLGAWVLASALGATVKKLQDSQAGIIIKKYL